MILKNTWLTTKSLISSCKDKNKMLNVGYPTVQPIRFSEPMLSDTLLCLTKNYLAFAGRRRKKSYCGVISLEGTVQVSPSVVNFLIECI